MPESTAARIIADLTWLVAADSQNPPRSSSLLVERLAEELGHGFRVSLEDLGRGCVNLLCVRGEPRVLVNVHVDTVPVCPGWQRDPFQLTVEGPRAYGLGACDIKGGAAALIEATRQTDAPAALLFTTDEEAGKAVCVRHFLEKKMPFDMVVVAEPTQCRAVTAHRGVASALVAFTGVPGHASSDRAREESANHALVGWAHAALARADAARDVRFNLGRIEGGEKSNMIAGRAEARFGLRPPPGYDPKKLAEEFIALAGGRASGEVLFAGPPLPAPNASTEVFPRARKYAERIGLRIGEAVEFWTEASLFSEAGYPTFVFGPGNIAQAHAADEWVAIADLEDAVTAYKKIFEGAASP